MGQFHDGGDGPSSQDAVESAAAETGWDSGDDSSAFATETGVESEDYQECESSEGEDGDDESPFAEDDEKADEEETNAEEAEETAKSNGQDGETDYSRPTHWRAGMRDEVWDNAKDEHGRVRDPVSGRYMSKDQPWDMGHKPGYEFRKHQESARQRGISRQEFLDEYYNVDHYRPELPESNKSHKGEDVTDRYFGD